MKKVKLLLLLTLFNQPLPLQAEQPDLEYIGALSKLIIDIEVYKGMFYSVHNYCEPHTNTGIATWSETHWNERNKSLYDAQKLAVQQFMELARKNGVEKEASAKLTEAKSTGYQRALNHNRLYKDIVPLEDKHIACSKRLGAMNSESMSFKNLAPDSYNFWQSHLSN